MMAKPIKTLEMRYPMIQFLIITIICLKRNLQIVFSSSLGEEEETMPIPQVQGSAETLLVQGKIKTVSFYFLNVKVESRGNSC